MTDENQIDTALLSETEARVLGCLMEKQLTTPDVYPLTLNSLVTACNQKTSREPVMNLQSGEVQRCLNELQERGLVEIDYGSRADKYDQRLNRKLHFDKADQSVFCLLLLRGPQTVNELFSRSKRMVDFASAGDIKDLIERHLAKLKPLLMTIPAQAGQREDRYMHLLCGEPDLSALAQARPAPATANTSELESRVAKLEEQMAALMAKLGE
ncbi:YceH family protein [Reinekea marinisedimentorum]|nr:DUF480 domain-containing protein [Reinekea marinisedimentorum]